MRYLVIDTCTERGLVALGSKDHIFFAHELPFGLNQSRHVMPILKDALKPFGPSPEIAAIGVGKGPGSYTGIRMGVAIAQTLAYSWKVPLIGVSSLRGFVPSQASISFAAILDARIGGVYFQKGTSLPQGVKYEGEPQICPLEELGSNLKDVTHLVTPHVAMLQTKLKRAYPDANWYWEEKGPSARLLLKHVEDLFAKGEMITPPQHLDLLYLRETEAERERKQQMKN